MKTLTDDAPAAPTPRLSSPAVSTPAVSSPTEADQARAARIAAITALQAVLEVLDGRRPLDKLANLTTGAVVDHVAVALRCRVAATARAPAQGAATRLRRVHLQMRSPRTAEVFGTVDHAGRVLAVVGRIQIRPVMLAGRPTKKRRWTLTEFGIV